jgi:hypothetical protein
LKQELKIEIILNKNNKVIIKNKNNKTVIKNKNNRTIIINKIIINKNKMIVKTNWFNQTN